MTLFSLYWIALLVDAAAPGGILPTTIAGWLTLFGLILTWVVVGYDRLVTKVRKDKDTETQLNEFGRRIEKVETFKAEYEGGAVERDRVQQNILRTQGDMAREMGETQALVRQGVVDMTRMTEELKKEIRANYNKTDAWERRVSLQLTALTTELRTRQTMSVLDRYPSTPVKLIVTQIMTVVFFIFSLHWIEHNVQINETVFSVMAAAILGADFASVLQFAKKRSTAWAPPVTESEVTKPATSGQPAKTDDESAG